MARLEARGLWVGAGGQGLLDVPDLAFDGPGPSVILGPNGAGKTLLLRCLHGLTQPDSGEVCQDGVPLAGQPGRRQAMVFQKPVLLRRTVAANLSFVLRRQGLSRQRCKARIADLLADAGLSALARRQARSLSGGEAQRLAIVRALAMQPAVLFLDEPTSALDPAATQAIETLILQASDRGTRVIMVSHDVAQARRIAAHIVLMRGGRVLEQAPAPQFFAGPKSKAARQFLAGGLLF